VGVLRERRAVVRVEAGGLVEVRVVAALVVVVGLVAEEGAMAVGDAGMVVAGLRVEGLVVGEVVGGEEVRSEK
jgi:hypothetical protein